MSQETISETETISNSDTVISISDTPVQIWSPQDEIRELQQIEEDKPEEFFYALWEDDEPCVFRLLPDGRYEIDHVYDAENEDPYTHYTPIIVSGTYVLNGLAELNRRRNAAREQRGIEALNWFFNVCDWNEF